MKQLFFGTITSILFFSLLVLPGISSGQELPEFQILTEDWVPYQYEEDGKLKGISVDLIVLLLQRVGSKQNRKDIKLYPWARGYDMLMNKENTILFSTTRTVEREKLVKWVGPIFSNSTILVGQKSKNMKIETKKDLHKYRIGTIINDSSELFMNRLGVPSGKLHRNVNSSNNIKKLEADRIDLVVTNWVEFKIMANNLNINPNLYEQVYEVDRSEIYYAFHRDTPDWIIYKFQSELERIKAHGELDTLKKKYEHLMY